MRFASQTCTHKPQDFGQQQGGGGEREQSEQSSRSMRIKYTYKKGKIRFG